ncbi:MAG: polysaccharide deacetylase family protein [Candidatus Erginobacter occultus]|nr:polysaccharide deacetylase family protein [Candidatus Erginobacter occultus]
MKNILTIDVESWIHFSDALTDGKTIPDPLSRKALDGGHLRYALEQTLEILDRSGNRATFFVLGELLQWDPDILEEIRRRGHEVGYHGHSHRMIDTPETLERELELSKNFIDRFRPVGFRAPRLFLSPPAMETLRSRGFIYSSSSYGPWESGTEINGVREIPISTLRWIPGPAKPQVLPRPLSPSLLFKEIPFGSGRGAGLLGGATSFFIRKANRRKHPAVIMLHPWQLFPPEEMTGWKFKFNILSKHTMFMPYAFSRAGALRKLVAGHKFISFLESIK